MSIVVNKTRLPVTQWQTESGSVVSISDARKRYAKSLSVALEPIQSLNGYANPWPAGGGKNVFDYSLLKDQVAWNEITLNLKPNTMYIMSTDCAKSTLPLYFIINNEAKGSSTKVTSDHSVKRTTGDTVNAKIVQRLVSGEDSFQNYHWQIEETSADSSATAWTPYSNICPISGWSNVNVYREAQYDAGATPYATISLNDTFYGGSLDVVSGVVTVDRAYASVASVLNKFEDANGYFWYTTSSTLGIPVIGELNEGLISDRFVKVANTTTSGDDGKITFYANGIIRWKEKGDLTLTDYRTYLASNPFQLVYEPATPQTIQLSPNEVEMLMRNNTIWSDAGAVTLNYARIHQ